MTLAPFHPFAMEYTADPRPYFAKFHESGALFEHAEFGAWFAHDYDAVRTFCDHPRLTRRPGAIPSFEAGAAERLARWPITESGMSGDGMQATEGDDRLVLRKLLAQDFRPGMIHRMTSTLRDVVANHCAPLQWERELDVVDLVQGVPLAVISRLLGISESGANAELFLTSAPDFFRGMSLLAPDDVRDRAEVAAQQMFQVLAEEVADRRANPRDDMILPGHRDRRGYGRRRARPGRFLDHMPTTARVDPDAITWDPTNILLREITSMPIRVR